MVHVTFVKLADHLTGKSIRLRHRCPFLNSPDTNLAVFEPGFYKTR